MYFLYYMQVMTNISLPQGWDELDEPHPDHGVVADSYKRFQHADGFEVIIWSGVVEDARDYTVEGTDEYALEVYNEEGEYLEGDAFASGKEAEEAADTAMKKFP